MYKHVIKRALDLLLGIIAAPFIGIACMIIAPMVYLEDKGPVFYNAPRVGKDRRLFKMYKFRTMRVNAPDLKMADGSTYNGPDDPRVTKIGAFLRKTSLDEIPQILNILKGDMSFIGPRPDLENEVALYFPGEEKKLLVKPGISGYAQVYGRNAIAWHDRIALDLVYIEKQSFLLDVKIFFKTFAVVLMQEGVFISEEEGDAGTGFKSIELLSLVVVAQNADSVITDLLNDIAMQDFPLDKIELILVDSMSDDNTKQLFNEFSQSQNEFKKVVVLDNPGKFLPHGCNVALKVYKGDVFLRVDAHARIPQDFARKNVEFLETGQYACGGVRPVVLKKPTAWGKALLLAEESVFGSSPAQYRRGLAKDDSGQKKAHSIEVKSVFRGAYRREVFDEVGLYNEQLKRTEDNDMSYRIRQAGYKIYMDPSIRSEHFLRGSLRQMLAQKAGNGYWVGRTLFVSPKCISTFSYVPLVFVLAITLGAVLGLLLSWYPLIALGCLYAAVAIAVSIKAVVAADSKNIFMLLLPFVFLLMHLAYGVCMFGGIVVGAIRRVI